VVSKLHLPLKNNVLKKITRVWRRGKEGGIGGEVKSGWTWSMHDIHIYGNITVNPINLYNLSVLIIMVIKH
jgi:hypothetical protein